MASGSGAELSFDLALLALLALLNFLASLRSAESASTIRSMALLVELSANTNSECCASSVTSRGDTHADRARVCVDDARRFDSE